MGVYLVYSDLFPTEKLGRDELLAALRSFSAEDLVQTLAKLSLFTSQEQTFNTAIDEFALLRPFFGREDFERMRLWKQYQRAQRITHRCLCPTAITQRLWLASESTEGVLVSGHEVELGRLLLLVNEHADPDYAKARESGGDDPAYMRQLVSALMYRMGFYYHRFNFGSTLGRYTGLLKHAAPAIRAQNPAGSLDLEQLVVETYGYTMDELRAYSFAVLAYYFQPAAWFAADPRRFLVGDGLLKALAPGQSVEKFGRFLGDISLGWAEYVKVVADSMATHPENWSEYLHCYRWPMLRMTSGAAFPLDIQFLTGRLTEGLYWDLARRLGKAGRDVERKKLNAMVGDMLDWYAAALVRSVTGRRRDPNIWCDVDAEIAAADGTSKPDIVVREGDTLYVIEVTTAAVSPPRAVALDYAALFAELKQLWFGRRKGKCGQLRSAIEGIKSGAIRLRGVSPRRVRTYVPVVVTLRNLPQWGPLVGEYFRLMEAEGVPKELWQRWEFWNIEDLEDMLRLRRQGVKWWALIQDRDAQGNPPMSMEQYLSGSSGFGVAENSGVSGRAA